jgi:TonB family protein
MKLLKHFILVLLITSNSLVFGQNSGDKSIDYYNKGLDMFQQKKYKEAAELFSLSADIVPHPDTYYNLAMTKLLLLDTCGYCENMSKAATYGDPEAGKLFVSFCNKYEDIINYDNSLHPDSLFFSSVKSGFCSNDKKRIFSIKNIQTGELTSFYISGNDTSANSKEDFLTTFPDLNKIDPKRIFYDGLEQLPQYPGGDDERIYFINSNLKYPLIAKEKGIQGTVYVSFVIEEDGSINDVKVVKGIGGGCDEECVKVVISMPKWIPAKLNGKPVRVQFTMPIKFVLS